MPTSPYTDGLVPQTTFRKPTHHVGKVQDEAALEFEFVAPVLATNTREIRPMVRPESSIESQAAAVRVLPKLTEIQTRLMFILSTEGPHNATDLERRTEFQRLAPSTVRKRLSELKQAGKIVQVGRKDGMAVWAISK